MFILSLKRLNFNFQCFTPFLTATYVSLPLALGHFLFISPAHSISSFELLISHSLLSRSLSLPPLRISFNALNGDIVCVPRLRNNGYIYLLRQTLRELVKHQIRGGPQHAAAATPDKSA